MVAGVAAVSTTRVISANEDWIFVDGIVDRVDVEELDTILVHCANGFPNTFLTRAGSPACWPDNRILAW
jgi:hypothetical protein